MTNKGGLERQQLGERREQIGGPLNLMDTWAAADYLGLSKKTLEAYRVRGGGPAYYDMGRIRYSEADLLTWLESRRRTSTSG